MGIMRMSSLSLEEDFTFICMVLTPSHTLLALLPSRRGIPRGARGELPVWTGLTHDDLT